MKCVGLITLGQSPRPDIVQNYKDILKESFTIWAIR